MFPYKSAVGLFIIQILKALALIKAVTIYPVSCYIYIAVNPITAIGVFGA